jgi:hypothetical protein
MIKHLSVVVILSLISLAIAPRINANMKGEFVEFTTEISGLNNGKYLVKLTQRQANEVKELFDSIRERLNTAVTKEELDEIFKNAFFELNKFGLLGGLSIKQVKNIRLQYLIIN